MEKIKNLFNKVILFFKTLENKMMRSENLVIILPIFLILLVLLFYIPYLFNNEDLKKQIEQKISSYTNASLEIKGSVKIALLPSPSITLQDVILKNYVINQKNYNLYSKEIKIRLSFLSSLIGGFKAKEILITQALLVNYSTENPPQSRSDNFEELTKSLGEKNKNQKQNGIGGNLFAIGKFDFKKLNRKNLPKISFSNAKLISYSKLGNKSEINDVNTSLHFSKNEINGEGNFLNQGIVNNFKFEIRPNSKEQDSILEIDSSYFNLQITGGFNSSKTFDSEDFTKYFKGTIEVEIFNLKDFYKSYVTAKGLIYNKINPATRPIKIKSTIIKNEDEIVMDNISISSAIINGRGTTNIDLGKNIPILDIRLALESIDLDAIWLTEQNVPIQENKDSTNNDEQTKQPASENTQDEDDKKNINEKGLDLTKDLRDIDFTIETKISQISYLGEKITNVNLYAMISREGEILFLPLNFEIPGKGLVRISGALENRAFPKFIGKIDARGEKLSEFLLWLRTYSQNLKFENLGNYIFYSDIMLMPNSTSLNNLYLNINNQDLELLGEIKIDYFNNLSNIISNLEIRELNIDNYFLTSGQNIYLSAGDLLKKLLWLNNISSQHDTTMHFDKLHYKDFIFADETLKARLGKGFLEIDKFKLNGESFDLETSLSIDIANKNPKLNLALRANNFYYKSPKRPAIDNLQNSAIINDVNFWNQIFALPSLEAFSGNILIDFKNADFDKFNIKNLLIDSKLRDGILEFSKFSGEIYNGKFNFIGSAGIKFSKAISGNIEIKNAKLKPFLSDIFSLNKIDGIANISSSISSYGDKKEDFKKNLNSEIKISAADLAIENYGLTNLVKKMFDPLNNLADLQDPEKILFDQNSTSFLKTASGKINVGRDGDNKFRFDFSATAISGVSSGKFNILSNKTEGSAAIIFLTGSRKKQIPINIATNFSGNFDNLLQNSNLDQAKQYIDLIGKKVDVAKIYDAIAKQKNEEKNQNPQNQSNQGQTVEEKAVKQRFNQQQLDEIQKSMSQDFSEEDKKKMPQYMQKAIDDQNKFLEKTTQQNQ